VETREKLPMSMDVDGPHINGDLAEATTRETPANLSFNPTLTNSKKH